MENAADALKMAAAVLIFVLALSISIVAFGQVRQTADVVLSYKDRETEYIESNNYYNLSAEERTAGGRYVGLETIIPTIYRVYRENYKIVFDFASISADPIYKVKNTTGLVTVEDRYELGYNDPVQTGQEDIFIQAILYGKNKVDPIAWNNFYATRVEIVDNGLVERLKTYLSTGHFVEKLGIYVTTETSDVPLVDEGGVEDDEVPDANLTETRIITYKYVSN